MDRLIGVAIRMMRLLAHCTCGARMVNGDLDGPHAPSCECSATPHPYHRRVKLLAGLSASGRPTIKQLRFLKILAAQMGEQPPRSGLTLAAASAEIDRLLALRESLDRLDFGVADAIAWDDEYEARRPLG